MKTTDKSHLQKVLGRRFLRASVVQILGATGALVLLMLLCIVVASQIYWYYDSLIFQLLSFIRNHLLFFFLAAWLVALLVVLWLQWRRNARYMVQAAEAIELIANEEDAAITLPEDLRELQDLLVRIQLQSRLNRQLAAEAEQRKNDLVVYLAHDLKTPLTSVLGYLTLLRDEPDLPPAQREKYLAIAAGKAQRLEDLINEFFEITRFNLKGLTLEPSSLNFSRMVEQVADEFQPILAEKNLRFDLSIQAGVTLQADPGKLERVLDNLLRNAVSYSYPDAAIALELTQLEDRVRLTVENRGDTIPPHKLEHLFEQFYRVDTARSTQGGGAGLGLAIAKEIVELHRGTILAESQDQWIRFTLELPLNPEFLGP